VGEAGGVKEAGEGEGAGGGRDAGDDGGGEGAGAGWSGLRGGE
jgi:hypothetical protein